MPALQRVVVLFNPRTSPYASFYLRNAQETAERLALEVTAASVNEVGDIDPAIAAVAGAGNGGLIVLPDGGSVASNNATLIAQAATHRVPAIYAVRVYAVNGGLMSYGADLTGQFRDGASYVDRILRGARPAELPVQFATKFDSYDQSQDRRCARPENPAPFDGRRGGDHLRPRAGTIA